MYAPLAIAKGEYKPGKNETKVWFESTKSMSQILSTEKQELCLVRLKHSKNME